MINKIIDALPVYNSFALHPKRNLFMGCFTYDDKDYYCVVPLDFLESDFNFEYIVDSFSNAYKQKINELEGNYVLTTVH